MTVQCPRCQTQYRVPESRLTGAQPVFKCTHCNRVFKSKPASGPRKRPRNEENLSFKFDREREAEIAAAADEPIDSDEDEPAFVSGLGSDGPRSTDRREKSDEDEDELYFEEDDEEEEEEIEEEDDEEEFEEEEEPVIVTARERATPIRPRARKTPPPRRSPLRPIGFCVAGIIGFWALVALSLDRDPGQAMDRLSDIPLLGQLLGRDHLLTWRLEVTDLEGGLDYIRDHKLAYVVSGRAINTTGQDLRIVEVEGGLIVDGKPARVQRVFAANQARSTIRDLSASEVAMLLRLEPNRRFRIKQGESASFLLVFPDPPQGFDEVVVRVIDARTT